MSQEHSHRDDEELGKLESGPRDSSLNSSASADDERLKLPEGAIVAFRKSGGFRFTTREITVYMNGEALYASRRGPGMNSQATALELSETQMLRLRRTLARIDFSKLPQGPGRPSPDAYVYEIAAHTLGQTHFIEAWDGSIPQEIKPLIEQLRRMMPN